MLLLQVSDYYIHEQSDTRLREAADDRLARSVRVAARPERRTTPVEKRQGVGRGPRLATRMLHRVSHLGGA